MTDSSLQRAEDLLMELLAIPGKSCQEGPVMEFIQQRLRQAGAADEALVVDQAHRHSPHGGEVGNLVLRLPGTAPGPRRLLMAHVDTVPLCVGVRPVRQGTHIVPADKETGLGADDRAGTAVLLATALELLASNRPHPPLTFLWTVQEEIGLFGTGSSAWACSAVRSWPSTSTAGRPKR